MPPSAVLSLTALIALGVLLHAWPWIKALPESAAAFVGALAGGAIGLFAILGGALYNAHLNRQRDERLLLHERRVLIASLRAEADLYRSTIQARITAYRNLEQDKDAKAVIDDVARRLSSILRFPPHPVFDSTAVKLGLLGAETASDLAHNYGIIDNAELTRRLAFEEGVSGLEDGRLITQFEGALAAAERNCTILDDAAKKLSADEPRR